MTKNRFESFAKSCSNSSLIFLLVVGFATGCTKNKASTPASVPPSAPADIKQSVAVGADGTHLKLQKASLGKSFLLRAAIKQASNSPTWADLQPAVVTFESNNAQLAMFAVNPFAMFSVIDSKTLLATFTIVNQTDTEIEFIWSGGFKITTSAPSDDPLDSTALQEEVTGDQTSSIEVLNSYVENSQVNGNQLHVRESDRVRITDLRSKSVMEKASAQSDADKATPVLETMDSAIEVDYRLESYQPSASFKPKTADSLRNFGFFTNSVGIPTLSSQVRPLAMHWDFTPSRGPVTYAISKYFPAELVPVATEAILYWNQSLGAGSVKVISGVDPEAEFPDRTVIVNWLPWADGAASWASETADPLTGEILRGQIYIASVFTQISSVFPATGSSPADNKISSRISLEGMPSSASCRLESVKMAQALGLTQQIPQSGVSQKAFLADVIRWVVAHESGHTLGLRHNFSASFDSPLDVTQINKAKRTYEVDPQDPGAEVSTSVMDYFTGLEEGMLGRWITKHSLKYDKAALAWVYSDQTSENSTLSYCTDEDLIGAQLTGVALYGCKQFDAPADPFNTDGIEYRRPMDVAVKKKFDLLVDQMFPSYSTEIVATQAVLNNDYATYGSTLSNPIAVAKMTLDPLHYLYNQVGSGASSVKRFQDVISTQWNKNSQPSVDLGTILNQNLTSVGGLAPYLQLLFPTDAAGNLDASYYQRQLQALVASPAFNSGVTVNGRAYKLTADQQNQLKVYLQAQIAPVYDAVAAAFTAGLPHAGANYGSMIAVSYIASSLDNSQLQALQSQIQKLVFWQNGTLAAKVQSQTLQLPVFTLNAQNRSDLLSKSASATFAMTGVTAPASIGQSLQAEMSLIYKAITPGPNVPVMPAPLVTSKDHAAYMDALVKSGAISVEAWTWAKNELQLMAVLEAMN